jgi:hypothetical protein
VLNVLKLMVFLTALLDTVIYTSRRASVRHGALAPRPRNLLMSRPGGEMDVKRGVRSSFPWRSGPCHRHRERQGSVAELRARRVRLYSMGVDTCRQAHGDLAHSSVLNAGTMM